MVFEAEIGAKMVKKHAKIKKNNKIRAENKKKIKKKNIRNRQKILKNK